MGLRKNRRHTSNGKKKGFCLYDLPDELSIIDNCFLLNKCYERFKCVKSMYTIFVLVSFVSQFFRVMINMKNTCHLRAFVAEIWKITLNLRLFIEPLLQQGTFDYYKSPGNCQEKLLVYIAHCGSSFYGALEAHRYSLNEFLKNEEFDPAFFCSTATIGIDNLRGPSSSKIVQTV